MKLEQFILLGMALVCILTLAAPLRLFRLSPPWEWSLNLSALWGLVRLIASHTFLGHSWEQASVPYDYFIRYCTVCNRIEVGHKVGDQTHVLWWRRMRDSDPESAAWKELQEYRARRWEEVAATSRELYGTFHGRKKPAEPEKPQGVILGERQAELLRYVHGRLRSEMDANPNLAYMQLLEELAKTAEESKAS